MKTNLNIRKISRRNVLKLGAGSAAGILLTDLLKGSAFGIPARKGKAKSVIQIWMWGGPSHLDTFDPKPNAGKDYVGGLPDVIDTIVPGMKINKSLPLLAKQADKFSIIRGMTHGVNGHESASYMVQTGWKSGDGLVHPSVGAVVSLKKGYDSGYKGLLPPYIVLTSPQGRFSEAGFLGGRYKPFATGGDPNKNPFTVEGIISPSISQKRQHNRRAFLQKLDTLSENAGDYPPFKKLDECREKAYEMILGDAGKVFDLSTEHEELRTRYGRNSFGQSCLMARRLVERGVPYITINYKGWDTHKQHFQTMRRKLPEMDKGFATLLQDLSDRDLLDSTIIWWGGEFGRTPKIKWDAPWNGGRGHFGKAFSSVLAGGGFMSGQVVGATNEKGEEVVERPVYPWDLTGSIYTKLGIDPVGKLMHPQGYDIPLLPLNSDGVESGGLLKEIM